MEARDRTGEAGEASGQGVGSVRKILPTAKFDRAIQK
jgi:hypothetical protein